MADVTLVTEWLDAIAARSTATALTEKLKVALAQNPSRSSYASVSEMAALAGLNGGAITRTAQSWGFRGWPELRLELRSRYLESLSFREVAFERRVQSSDPVAGSLDADRRALLVTSSATDGATVRAVAEAAARAQRRVVVGSGTYRSVAELLATYATLAGYPTSAPDDAAGLVGALSELGPGDLIVGVDLWRGYATTLEALRLASECGATVCLITDRGASHLGDVVDHLLHVSSESSSFFPTLVPAVALVNAIASELASLDPAIAESASSNFDRIWRRMGFEVRHL